jgi:hypothetical protein
MEKAGNCQSILEIRFADNRKTGSTVIGGDYN